MAGQQSFSAAIDAWVAESEKRVTAVFRLSTQEVIAEAQRPVSEGGRMRVDTGFLRSSLVVALNAELPQANRPNAGGVTNYNQGAIVATIAGAVIGDFITAGYTANYAVHREYGARGQAPDAFVRTAMAKWPAIVSGVVEKAKVRVAARKQ